MPSIKHLILLLLLFPTGLLVAQSGPTAGFDYVYRVDPTCVQVDEGAHIELISSSTGAVYYEWSTNLPEAASILLGPHPEQPLLNLNFDRTSPPSQVVVTLVVSDSTGNTDTLSQTIPTNLHFAPVVQFAPRTEAEGCAPYLVAFTDMSWSPMGEDIDTYEWDFGNGETSAEASPEYSFGAAGNYSVTLTVTDESGCSAQSDRLGTILTLNVLPKGECQ